MLIIAINLALGFLPCGDDSAHIGGLLSGFSPLLHSFSLQIFMHQHKK
ncbi:hypothetical protein ACB092_05G294000 [Castanea dentata]